MKKHRIIVMKFLSTDPELEAKTNHVRKHNQPYIIVYPDGTKVRHEFVKK